MEYHLYRSNSRGNVETYYCSFDVASNESPFDVARRNLLGNINDTAYFWKRYKSVTKNLLIAMYTPNAIDEEQKRVQYFILSKNGPYGDVEEVEETYKGGFTNSQIQKIANRFTTDLHDRLRPRKRVEVEETRRILKEVVKNKFFYRVRLMQDDQNKAGAITCMGFYAEDSEEAVTETIRRLAEHCDTDFKGSSRFHKGKLQTDDGEVDIVIEHHVEDNHDIPLYYSRAKLERPQKWSVRIYKIEKDEIGEA